MYNFKDLLKKDEKILWQGKPVPSKHNKDVLGEIIVILIVLGMAALMIASIIFGWGDGVDGITFEFIILMAVVSLFIGLCLYSIVNKLFFKEKNLQNTEYCLTNKRVIRYNLKKDKVLIGNLINYHVIITQGGHGKISDIHFEIAVENENDPNNLKLIAETTIKQNTEDMPAMVFESIENAKEVKQLAIEARNELIKENEQPTINGIRI